MRTHVFKHAKHVHVLAFFRVHTYTQGAAPFNDAVMAFKKMPVVGNDVSHTVYTYIYVYMNIYEYMYVYI